jgi:hypothetical protein
MATRVARPSGGAMTSFSESAAMITVSPTPSSARMSSVRHVRCDGLPRLGADRRAWRERRAGVHADRGVCRRPARTAGVRSAGRRDCSVSPVREIDVQRSGPTRSISNGYFLPLNFQGSGDEFRVL